MSKSSLVAQLAASTVTVEGADVAYQAALHLLADGGAPVPIEALARRLGWPADRVDAVLRSLPDVERNANGALVGIALTLNPTPHVFEIHGHTLYTWCAFDALFLPAILGKPADARSVCAATGVPIRLHVTPEKVEGIDPASTVVSLVGACGPTNLRASFCNEVNFFASAEAARPWLQKHSSGCVVSVEEAFAMGQEFAAKTLAGECLPSPVRSTFRRIAPVFVTLDLARALREYAKLGFAVQSYEGGDDYGYVYRDGIEIHLSKVDGLDCATTISCAYIWVDDADALYTEWSAAGVLGRISPPRDTAYGLREGAYVDPDGNLIRFGSPPVPPRAVRPA